jgi:hypothetical protein
MENRYCRHIGNSSVLPLFPWFLIRFVVTPMGGGAGKSLAKGGVLVGLMLGQGCTPGIVSRARGTEVRQADPSLSTVRLLFANCGALEGTLLGSFSVPQYNGFPTETEEDAERMSARDRWREGPWRLTACSDGTRLMSTTLKPTLSWGWEVRPWRAANMRRPPPVLGPSEGRLHLLQWDAENGHSTPVIFEENIGLGAAMEYPYRPVRTADGPIVVLNWWELPVSLMQEDTNMFDMWVVRPGREEALRLVPDLGSCVQGNAQDEGPWEHSEPVHIGDQTLISVAGNGRGRVLSLSDGGTTLEPVRCYDRFLRDVEGDNGGHDPVPVYSLERNYLLVPDRRAAGQGEAAYAWLHGDGPAEAVKQVEFPDPYDAWGQYPSRRTAYVNAQRMLVVTSTQTSHGVWPSHALRLVDLRDGSTLLEYTLPSSSFESHLEVFEGPSGWLLVDPSYLKTQLVKITWN